MLATGCANNAIPGGSTEVKDNSSALADDTGTGDNNTDSGNSEPDAKSVKDAVKDIKVDTKVKVLAWYDLNDWDIAKTYKELFGVPENIPAGYEESKTVKNSSDSESSAEEQPFVSIYATYQDRYMKLARLVQSDESPDCIPFEKNLMLPIFEDKEDLIQNVDNIIDLNIHELAVYKDESDRLSLEGKHYVPVTDLSTDTVISYRASVIAKNGLEDPWELYQKGEWTWDKFLEMSKQFADSENGRYAFDGYWVNIAGAFISTTGETFITLDDKGNYKNNCRNEKIRECMNYLRRLAMPEDDLRYPNNTENGWSPDKYEWADGNTLFFIYYLYNYDSDIGRLKERLKWDDNEIKFAPIPVQNKGQTEYQPMNAEGYLLIKGAKNIDGYKSLVYTSAYHNNFRSDEEIKAKRESMKSEGGWSDLLLDRINELDTPGRCHAVFELSNPYNVYDDCFYSTPYSECIYSCLEENADYEEYADYEEFLRENQYVVDRFEYQVEYINGER